MDLNNYDLLPPLSLRDSIAEVWGRIFFLIWVSGLSKVLVENLLDYRALAKQMTSTDMCQNFQVGVQL